MDVRLMIDGTEVAARAGASLLEVARGAGHDIPALCHHPAVSAIAACRLCLVEVRRPGHFQPLLTTSCDYPVAADLDVITDSPRIRQDRVMNLQLLLPYAPDAPALRALAARLRIARPLFAPVTDAALPGCILCELCVRICSTLGFNALSTIGRGDHKRVAPPFGQAAATACVGCGSCHAVCPTGCIAMEETASTRAIWGRTFDFFLCSRCQKPLMTVDQHSVTAARGDLPEEACDLCQECKRTVLSERLITSAK